MTDLNHDTFTDLEDGTPNLFTAAAIALPIGLGGQFMLAGQALFGDSSWDMHILLGGVIGLAVFMIFGYAVWLPRLRGFMWWASTIVALYLTQVALAAGGPTTLVFHPFNAALLLVASVVMAFKVERRKGASRRLA